MSRKVYIGEPERSGPFQDFPIIRTNGASISDWIESLPTVDEPDEITNINTQPTEIDKKIAEIAERKLAISKKIAKLKCIRETLDNTKNKIDNIEEYTNIDNSDSIINEDLSQSHERCLFENEPDYIQPNEKICQEKESIWQRVKKRTNDLYYKAGMYVGKAMFAAGSISASKLFSKPEIKIGENLVEYERRVKRIGMAKVISLTVLSIFTVHSAKNFIENFNDTINGQTATGGNDRIDHTLIDNTLNRHDIINVTPDFSFEAYNINPGEGWYSTMNQMGITDPASQFNTLQIAGPKLQNIGVAYAIDDGTWGITNTGQLPKDALNIIWESNQSVLINK